MTKVLAALLTTLLLSGCVTNKDKASQSVAAAKVVRTAEKQVEEQRKIADQRVVAALSLPEYPISCRRNVNSNVSPGDNYKVALEKLDASLWEANKVIRRCSDYYSNLRKERNGILTKLKDR